MNVTSKSNISLAVIGVIAIVLVIAQPIWPPAAVVTTLALIAVPGQAVTTWIPLPDRGTQIVYAAVIGVSVLAVAALLMVWTKYWHPRPAAAVVLAIGTVSLLVSSFVPGRVRHDKGVAA